MKGGEIKTLHPLKKRGKKDECVNAEIFQLARESKKKRGLKLDKKGWSGEERRGGGKRERDEREQKRGVNLK